MEISALFANSYRVIPNIVTKVGSAAAPFLKLETGIREIGMSGAQVASAAGISSLPYNPASIGFVQNREMFFNKTDYLLNGINYMKPEMISMAITYISTEENLLSINFEYNRINYYNHYNNLEIIIKFNIFDLILSDLDSLFIF